jgi:hypothetical protein
MEATLFVAAIVCVLVGYLAARIEYNKKLKEIRHEYIVKKKDDFHAAFDAGWDGALASSFSVEAAYKKLFKTTN